MHPYLRNVQDQEAAENYLHRDTDQTPIRNREIRPRFVKNGAENIQQIRKIQLANVESLYGGVSIKGRKI
jgi:hypothetical protein